MPLEMSPPLGIVCTPEEYERSLQDPLFYCLTRPDTIGLIFRVEAGFVSLIAILCVFLIILRNVIWRIKNLSKARFRIFHQPMDLLMFSLFFGDLLQAIGVILSLNSIQSGKVEMGAICSVQGNLTFIGEAVVAITSLAITMYTFIGILKKQGLSSMKIAFGVVCGIWFFVLVLACVGNNNHNTSFMTPTPYWCWMGGDYFVWRLFAVYMWIWLALLCSLFCYVLLYLWMRGNIVINEQKWWKISFQIKVHSESDLASHSLRRRSSVMLLYPLANSVVYLPTSVFRWSCFVNGPCKSGGAAFVVTSIFCLSGFINVVLMMSTRPHSGLFGELMFRQPILVRLLPLVQGSSVEEGRQACIKLNHNFARDQLASPPLSSSPQSG